MANIKIALLGGTLFLISILFANKIHGWEKGAQALNKSESSHAIIQGPPPCNWEVLKPESVISENKSTSITINTKNQMDTNCETVIYFRAPNFDLSPAKDSQTIKLEASKSGSISWIVTPRKVGDFEISVTDDVDTKIFGISVKNLLGLSAIHAKILSALGTIFGPMLTVPWWWDRLKKRKPEQAAQ